MRRHRATPHTVPGLTMWADLPSECKQIIAAFFFDRPWYSVGGWQNLRAYRFVCKDFGSQSNKIYDNLLQHKAACRLGNNELALLCPEIYTRAVTMFVIREISHGTPVNLGAYSLIYHRVYNGATCMRRPNNPADYYNTLIADSPSLIHMAKLSTSDQIAVVRILSGVFKYVQLRYCARKKLKDIEDAILSELLKLKARQ